MTDEVLLNNEGVDRRVRVVVRWLENVSRAVESTFELANRAESFYMMADNLRGIDYSRDMVATSPTPDAIPNAIIRAEELGEIYDGIHESAAKRVAQVENALALMEDQMEARALSLYYMSFDEDGRRMYDTWDKVAHRMGYTQDGIMKLRRRALLHAYDVMPHSERDPIQPAI